MSEQGSPEWFAERCGKVTASRIADMMAQTKTGYGASRANYLAQLAVERLTGQPAESYSNAEMRWGTDTEPQARAVYAFLRDVEVEEVGFVRHPTIAMAGASPDGLVGTDGMIEIKCPNSATHLATLRGAPIAQRYIFQMQWQMECTGRGWCDFMSFDPRFPADLQAHIRCVERDDVLIDHLEENVCEFLEDVDRAVRDVRPDAAREALRDDLRQSISLGGTA